MRRENSIKKKSSIKARVTLWYTILMLVILVIGAAYLLSLNSNISRTAQQQTLVDTVTATIKDIRFTYSELDDAGVDFYRDGVSIFLYDTKGRLLAPKINSGLKVDSVLTDRYLRTVSQGSEKWLVYDLYSESAGPGCWIRGIFPLSHSQETLRRMQLLILAAVPFFTLLAAVGGYYITKRAFARVGAMAKTAEAITSGQDLSRRLPDDGSGDELSMLGHAMNSMLERLQASFDRERRFTSDVSHELRTPTAVILSQCEYALTCKATADKDESLQSIRRQAGRISSIVSQLLLMIRAENGKFCPAMEPLSIGELCEMIVMEMEETARAQDVRLECSPDRSLVVNGDETLLIRMVTNLLSNAIRYNRPGGTVRLTVDADHGRCLIRVADTGIGISPDNLGRIWERFYRADSARSGDGSGLGLPMVRFIANLHGGDVDAESHPGKGSIFTVTLPLAGNGELPQKIRNDSSF